MIKLDLKYNKSLEDRGVIFININLTYIKKGAKIEKGAVIYPLTFIDEKSVIKEKATIQSNVYINSSTIGKGTIINSNSEITDSKIADNVVITNSVVLSSTVGSNTKIGPFAYLRPGSKIGKNCKIGDFVEIKNSTVSDNSKASHLTYVGDAKVGKNVNMGCGTIFVNYDGVKKYESVVGNDVFIGCNSNIISPRKINDESFIAAGSTVNKDVPKGSLFIERADSRIIKDFPLAKEIKKKNKKVKKSKK